MSTLAETIAELDAAGFRDAFRAERGALRALAAGRSFAPESLVVEDVRRFEGESDPDEMAIVFALRSAAGDVRGTFTAEYGAKIADPAAAEMMARLRQADRRSRQPAAPLPKLGTMETISEALARLEAAGFRDSFRAERGGLWALAAERFFVPESLVVEEVHRFEGESDPDDMEVLFVLRSDDGDVRGTFTAEYGAKLSDPEAAEVMRRLARASARSSS